MINTVIIRTSRYLKRNVLNKYIIYCKIGLLITGCENVKLEGENLEDIFK